MFNRKLNRTILLTVFGVCYGCGNDEPPEAVIYDHELADSAISVEGKKVLFINSYHKGNRWSDDIENGVRKIFDQSSRAVDLKFFRMDSKRNKSEKFMKLAALRAKQLILTWEPEIVIAADDNASKYIVSPYIKGTSTPVVFCGVNWDASEYGFPCANITGMIEVNAADELVKLLRQYAKGDRLAIIAEPTFTTKKVIRSYKSNLGLTFTEEVFPEDFDEWKKEYLRLQSEADMLIFLSHSGVEGWDHEKAVKFIHDNTQIPSGCSGDHLASYALVTYGKIAEEQGVWAASAALRILDGTPPGQIPIVKNSQLKIILNMQLAKKLEIKFPLDLLDKSILLTSER